MGINCFPMAFMEKKVDKNCRVSFVQGLLLQEQKGTVLDQ